MKIHVYIIDDDEDDVDFIMEAFYKMKYDCNFTWAKSGEQAIRQLQDMKPDIIFIDYNMHRMNGIQCLQVIKSLTNCDNVPAILHSTCMTEELASLGLQAGAYKCLEKPRSMNELMSFLQQFAFELHS
jgi:DNA-binding response OmpR family regulator